MNCNLEEVAIELVNIVILKKKTYVFNFNHQTREGCTFGWPQCSSHDNNEVSKCSIVLRKYVQVLTKSKTKDK